MKPKPIIIVQGAQYGSCAKGMVAAALCERREVRFAVRTGAVNAGHTVYYHGKRYVMQQLPTGWVNPGTDLVIGPGAYINPPILEHELNMVREAGYKGLVYVDHRAGLHLPEHTDRSSASGRHHSIGATGKGCSEAIIDRIRLRGNGGLLFKDWWDEYGSRDKTNFIFADTVKILNVAYDTFDQILLEGTQGTLLDLCLGPYPFTTHKQCTAAQWVTEAGLSPALDYEVVLVARTYPIRVAGNSGPMPQEIDWPTLADEINDKLQAAGKEPLVADDSLRAFITAKASFPKSRYSDHNVWASESDRDAWSQLLPYHKEQLSKLFEFTTVTKKLRRIARLDIDSLKYSVMVNRPSYIVMTFMNYEFPESWGKSELDAGDAKNFCDYTMNILKQTGARVAACTTGPESKHWIQMGLTGL